jgi:hypothetical protein
VVVAQRSPLIATSISGVAAGSVFARFGLPAHVPVAKPRRIAGRETSDAAGQRLTCGQPNALWGFVLVSWCWISWLETLEKPEGQSGKVVHLKKPH